LNKFDVVIENVAEQDLRSIFKYISDTFLELNTANNILHDFYTAIDSLEVFPLRHPVILKERYPDLNLRRLVVKNYSIIYYVDVSNNIVHILSVISNRRDLNKIFNES
jgi:mRNA-degrading endonuclease RelE of RelBE toxin-antitoxin system